MKILRSECTYRAEAAQGMGRPLISVYSDYAGRCEVLRLLLLLLIEPTSQNIRDVTCLFTHGIKYIFYSHLLLITLCDLTRMIFTVKREKFNKLSFPQPFVITRA